MSRRLSSPGRRTAILGALLLVVGLLLGLASPAIAQAGSGDPGNAGDTTATTGSSGSGSSTAGFVAVLKVSGLLDPVMVDAVSHAVSESEAQGAKALVLQANSGGVVVSESTYVDLLNQIASSSVPVDVWVGPSGSALTGPAAQLVGVARSVGMAPGTRLGDTGPLPAGVPFDEKRMAPLRDHTVSSGEAKDLGITARDAPTIGDFIIGLDGVETRQITQGDQQRLVPVTQVQFSQLSLVSQLFHTVASPAVAYLLLAIGLALLIFELFTAGVGVAGVVGAGAFILACYGLAVLPTRGWALAAIVVAMVAFAIDVQTGVPRFWTAAGMVLFVVATLFLFPSQPGVSMSWLTMVVGIGGIALTFITAMPAMVRTRFSTPTIGREWMIGEMGRAVTAISPDGTVQVREALWRAYTNRATPIEELDRVRVVGIEGLVLEVEPEEGAARDYRERSPRKPGADD
ncbi:MAG TPA: NfeD family protein [Acidimicrobiales bacterium]